MNVGLNNLNVSSVSKQDSSKRTNEKNSGDFEKSLNDSLNSANEKKPSNKILSKIHENNIEINQWNINDEDLEILNVIVYLLNLVCNEDTPNENIFDFTKNENLDLSFENKIDKNLFENKVDEKSLSKILYDLGFDKDKIDFKNITKGEVVQKILDNSESFKMIVKDEVVKFDEEILKFFDSENFLNDKNLLDNIKNEISLKINQSLKQEVPKEVVEYEKINVLNEIKNDNSTDAENILKEISGDTDFNKSIESYLVDTVRNNDFPIENFEKTIDATTPVKFVKEFVESIKYMSENNKSEMIVKINPEHLGKMDIKYEFVKDSVRLMIRVENSEALKLMDNTIVDIKNMIRENHQINLENIHVDLQQFEFNSNDKNSKRDENQNNSKNKGSIKIEDEENIKDKNDLRSGILV